MRCGNRMDSIRMRAVFLLLLQICCERRIHPIQTIEGSTIAAPSMAMMMAAKIPLPILQLDHAMALLEDHSYAQVVKLTGISKSTLIRERKRRRQFGEPEK